MEMCLNIDEKQYDVAVPNLTSGKARCPEFRLRLATRLVATYVAPRTLVYLCRTIYKISIVINCIAPKRQRITSSALLFYIWATPCRIQATGVHSQLNTEISRRDELEHSKYLLA